jgi:hypothetical protein
MAQEILAIVGSPDKMGFAGDAIRQSIIKMEIL